MTFHGHGHAALVEALRARGEDAYLALVRRCTPLMLSVARGVAGRREVAEDVVQDTWVAVLRSVERGQPGPVPARSGEPRADR